MYIYRVFIYFLYIVAVFAFTRQSYAVNEGETVEICIGVSNNVALQNDVSIVISSEGIEATGK